MEDGSTYDQLGGLCNFLGQKPDFAQIIEYLSANIAPNRQLCGVTLGLVSDVGVVEATLRNGFTKYFAKTSDIIIDSNFPVAIAIREQRTIFTDIKLAIEEFPNLPEEFGETDYKSICHLPLNESFFIMLTFEISYFEILRFEKYFECVRSILILYLALQTKKFVNEFELSGQLSPRQKHIYSSIQEGKSNRQIAMELSYSIS